ncbi:MAG: zinc-binding dehydrogenase [Deltaproteobacteria bacterium]|nr:zinc-binding dehydrogenase [Deltaproteobacteria bacterium]MBW2387345.1 zinc-binding dehydrogenase [Deltaproteobacteria bacterium]MBW2724049.1 zinc-binding dehydrogenase [Deltaproteobacteria bacterium]
MKQVNIHGADRVEIDEVPEPTPGPRDAVIRVSACGICGSDLGYIKLGGLAGPTEKPMPIGHEFSGVVESVGSQVTELAPGARVVVNPMSNQNQIGNGSPEGAFAPLVLVPNAADGKSVFEIPEQMPMDLAALAEPLSVGLQAVDRARPQNGEKAVVFGAGPIGLCVIASLKYRGIEDIIAVDLSARRLEIARKLGARSTLDPGSDDVWSAIRELHGTSPLFGAEMAGSDLYIEASGASVVIEEVLANARSEARLCVVGLHRTPIPVNFLLVMMKSLNIVGSMAYPDDWSEALALLTAADLSPMITHRFPLDDFHTALATAQRAEAGAKIMIINENLQ